MPIAQTSARQSASRRGRDKRESCAVSSLRETFTSLEAAFAPAAESVEAFTLVLRTGTGSNVCDKGRLLAGMPGPECDSTRQRKNTLSVSGGCGAAGSPRTKLPARSPSSLSERPSCGSRAACPQRAQAAPRERDERPEQHDQRERGDACDERVGPEDREAAFRGEHGLPERVFGAVSQDERKHERRERILSFFST